MELEREDEQRRLRHMEISPAGSAGLRQEWSDLQDALREFRDAVHAGAERPDSFWESQRSAIGEKLQKAAPPSWRHPLWLSVPIAAGVLLCLSLFVEKGEAPPAPDFAAGSDQDLLIDVERSVDRPYPVALEPVTLITQEMVVNDKSESPKE